MSVTVERLVNLLAQPIEGAICKKAFVWMHAHTGVKCVCVCVCFHAYVCVQI